MASRHIDRIDDAFGTQIERLVIAHHHRRLKRHGWAHAYAPSDPEHWCAGDPEPREGNAVELMIDGAEALPRLEHDIANARESVLLAGWHFQPDFRLSPGGPTLRELLADAAERVDVRVLAWAGAPLPLFTPARKDVRAVRTSLIHGTRIRMELDSRERPMHCHHEKLAVIDGRVAFVGGIDLTALAGDRLDSHHHPARGGVGWHDAASRVEGPLVADVAAHIGMRWHEVTGERLEQVILDDRPGTVTAQFVRTVPNSIYDALPRGDFRIFEAYVRALRSATKLVYLESQFLWSPELVELLEEKLRRPPTDEFRMVLLLPARPNNGGDDTRGQLGRLVSADRDERLLACTLYQSPRADQVYVHAKIGIVDDRWLCIGSANLNDHSMFNDTEACLITCDPELVLETRLRLWREHLHADDPSYETWRERADDESYDRVQTLPHVSRRSRSFLGPINGLLVDG
jgi:phosphatidylserine/phosphatidylglycerophosphate/cardiolipin synthase-like enzyme